MLQRRSQRHNLSWERFRRLEKRYIPSYRHTHPYPEQRFGVTHPRQEPCAGMPLAGICAGGRRVTGDILSPLAGEGRGEGGKLIVAVDPRYFRPTEVETLLGDPAKAKEKLANAAFTDRPRKRMG